MKSSCEAQQRGRADERSGKKGAVALLCAGCPFRGDPSRSAKCHESSLSVTAIKLLKIKPFPAVLVVFPLLGSAQGSLLSGVLPRGKWGFYSSLGAAAAETSSLSALALWAAHENNHNVLSHAL